jgi:hypothetical protein
MSGPPVDDWVSMCEHWRALGLKHYVPLSESKCNELVQETIQDIKTHKLPEGTKAADGRRDSIVLDADERYVRFVTRKTLDADMKQVMEHAWSLYQDSEALKKAHFGENCELFLHTLQWISPDMMIIQRVEQYPSLQSTHAVALIFRVQTETGYMIVLRCIESPQLQSVMKAEGFNLCGSFHWETFDTVRRDAQGDALEFTVAGSIGSENPAYAKRWRDDLLAALVRYEAQYLDKPAVSTESPTEGNAVTSGRKVTP